MHFENKSVRSHSCHKETHHLPWQMAAGHTRLLTYLGLAHFSFLHHSFISFLSPFSLPSSSSCLLIPTLHFPSRNSVEGKATKTHSIPLLMCEIEFNVFFKTILILWLDRSHQCYHSEVISLKKKIHLFINFIPPIYFSCYCTLRLEGAALASTSLHRIHILLMRPRVCAPFFKQIVNTHYIQKELIQVTSVDSKSHAVHIIRS